MRGRVIATVECEMHGSLLLVHLEGFSESTVLWLHREEDSARIAPLVTTTPGSVPPPTGPNGADTEQQFAMMVASAQKKLMAGKAWSAPSEGAPSVFSVVGNRLILSLRPDPQAWLQSQHAILRQPFISSNDMHHYKESCMAMYEAAVSGTKPPGYGMGAPLNITATGLMITPGAEFIVANPSVHPPSPERTLKHHVSWGAAEAEEAVKAASKSPAGWDGRKRRPSHSLSSNVARRLPAVEEERASILALFSFRGSSKQLSVRPVSERFPDAPHPEACIGAVAESPEEKDVESEQDAPVGLVVSAERTPAAGAVPARELAPAARELVSPTAELSSVSEVDAPAEGAVLSAEGQGAPAGGGETDGAVPAPHADAAGGSSTEEGAAEQGASMESAAVESATAGSAGDPGASTVDVVPPEEAVADSP